MTEWKEEIFSGIPIENVAFSTDNKILAVSSKYNVTLCYPNSKTSPMNVECSSSVVSVHFTSPEEFTTVTTDGELTTWELISDEVVKKDTRRVTAFFVKNVVWSHSKKHSGWITEFGSDRAESATLSVLMKDQSLEKLDEVPASLCKDQLAVTDSFIVYCHGKEIVKIDLDPEENEEHREVFIYTSVLNGLSAEQNEKNTFVRIAAINDTVVASLNIGKVYVWNNLSTKKLTLSSAFSLHWHKVSAPMALTEHNGLISAGAETVLCKWSLKAASSPTLLSRLQASVTQVVLSEDGSQAALLMEDNSVHIVLLSTMSILCSVPSVTYSNRCLQTVFMSDSRVSDAIVMNGTPGWIQWLDLSSQKTLRQANLSMENAVEGDMSDIRFAQVYHQLEMVFLSQNSAVSLESLVNFEQDHKRLRFWKRISKFDGEAVDTISVPTTTQFISGCRKPVSDSDEIYLTCTTSGSIDVWYQNEDKTHWFKDISRSVSSWQNTPILSVSSVAQGGFWASAHLSLGAPYVVIWDISNMNVLEVFRADGELQSVEWASNSLLIISTSVSITCWNLKTLSPSWVVEQSLNCHISEIGCFGWENDQVIEFNPFTGGLINSIRFSSNVHDLVAVNLKNSTALVAKTDKGLAIMKSTSVDSSHEVEPPSITPFSRLTSLPTAGVVSKVPRTRVGTRQSVLKLLDAPCHSLPPLSHIAPLFIASCLAPPCDS